MKLDIYNLTLDELTAHAEGLGERSFRARQVWEWLYRHHARTWDEMANVPKSLRAILAEGFTLNAVRPVEQRSDEEAQRWTLELAAGGHVEMAAFRGPRGWTSCLSTQVGCAVGCAFCASGAVGLERNLSAGEMVGQLLRGAGEPDGVVFMGIGEPFHNYEALLKAIHILSDERGYAMSPGRMTVSTSGVVPMIERFGAERLRTHLAISLNTTDEKLRQELMPGVRHSIAETVAAADEYVKRSGRRVTYAYVLLRGVNDSPREARRLADLLRGRLCHVNLIPYNPSPDASGKPIFVAPTRERVAGFFSTLEQGGVTATVRFSKGAGVEAACGQLRLRRLEGGPMKPVG